MSKEESSSSQENTSKTSHINEEIRKLKLSKKPQSEYICHHCFEYRVDPSYIKHLKEFYNGICPECEELNLCYCHDKYNCRCKVKCVCLCKNDNKGECEKECNCECICEDDCKTYCSEYNSLNLCKCECHEDYTDMAVDSMNADLNDP
jgi:hypothetical protein